MANVKFLRGTLANYLAMDASKINNDSFYITTDEGGIYLGQKRLGDFVKVAAIANLPAASAASTYALYYAEKENVLARSNGSAWVQINAAGLTEVNQTASGDFVSSVSVATDATGAARTLKITRSNLADTPVISNLTGRMEDVEESLSALTGGSGSGSIADMIEAAVAPVRKAAADAQGTADGAVSVNSTQNGRLESLEGRMDTAEGDISQLKTDVANNKTAAETAVSNLSTSVDNRFSTVNSDISTINGNIDSLEDRVEANEGKIATLNGNAQTAGSVDYKIAQAIATIMENPDTALNSIQELVAYVEAHKPDYLALVGRVATAEADIDNLEGRMDDAEGDLAVIKGTGEGSIKKAVADLKGSTTAYHTLAALEAALAAVKSTADGAVSVNNTQNSKIEAAEGRLDTAEGNITTLQTNLTNLGTTVTNNYNTLDGRITSEVNTIDGKIATINGTLDDHEGRIEVVEAALAWGSFDPQ